MSHEGPHYKKFVSPYDRIHCGYGNNQDLVQDAEGKTVGISMWPLLSEYYHDVISLCCIDAEFAQIGTEVTVVWGDAADEKKAVKATVALPVPRPAEQPQVPRREDPALRGVGKRDDYCFGAGLSGLAPLLFEAMHAIESSTC